MKKSDIETLELAGKVYPAVKISPDLPLLPRVAAEQIEKAWAVIEESFWMEFVPELVFDIFGDSLATFSAGDENEWLCIGDLAPIQVWPALMVNKWRSLQSQIRLILADITSPAYFLSVLKYELDVDTEGASGYRLDRKRIEPKHDGSGEGRGRGKGCDGTYASYTPHQAELDYYFPLSGINA